MANTERLHFRVCADTQARLRSAAEMEHQSLTEFVLSAAEERAESVLSRRTTLHVDFFEAMFNALSEPPHPFAGSKTSKLTSIPSDKRADAELG